MPFEQTPRKNPPANNRKNKQATHTCINQPSQAGRAEIALRRALVLVNPPAPQPTA